MRFVLGLIITQLARSTEVERRHPLTDVTNRTPRSDPIPIPSKSVPTDQGTNVRGNYNPALSKLEWYVGGSKLVRSLISEINEAENKDQLEEIYREAVGQLERAQREKETALNDETDAFLSQSSVTPEDHSEVVYSYRRYHDQITQAAIKKWNSLSD